MSRIKLETRVLGLFVILTFVTVTHGKESGGQGKDAAQPSTFQPADTDVVVVNPSI